MNLVKDFILVGAGGALGAALRYGVSVFCVYFFKHPFPFATLFVNAAGSFLIGVLAVLILPSQNSARLFLIVGLLGGFTTFSSFSHETLLLIHSNQMFHAFLNIFLNVFLCLLFVFLGFKTAKIFL